LPTLFSKSLVSIDNCIVVFPFGVLSLVFIISPYIYYTFIILKCFGYILWHHRKTFKYHATNNHIAVRVQEGLHLPPFSFVRSTIALIVNAFFCGFVVSASHKRFFERLNGLAHPPGKFALCRAHTIVAVSLDHPLIVVTIHINSDWFCHVYALVSMYLSLLLCISTLILNYLNKKTFK